MTKEKMQADPPTPYKIPDPEEFTRNVLKAYEDGGRRSDGNRRGLNGLLLPSRCHDDFVDTAGAGCTCILCA